MKKFRFLLLICVLSPNFLLAQTPCDTCPGAKKKKGSFYLLWGYNRDWYAKSTIHFRNDGDPTKQDQFGVYDFKIYDAKAKDRPDFRSIITSTKDFTVPQFSFRIGYYFNDKKDQGIEINYDHSKYVVTNYQKVRMAGSGFGQAFDKDTILDPQYIHFEHTDGANFALVNYMRKWSLWNSKNGKHTMEVVGKAGLGFVYPRTDVTIFGNRVNNDWHVAGVCTGLETGFRGVFWKHYTVEFTGKGVAANYAKSLVQGRGHGKASHNMLCAEAIFCFGYTF